MKKPTIQEKLPRYLHPYIAKQNPALYTAMDHASWRFILRCSMDFFSKNAHQKYLDGLRETGISIDRIPLISEMDEKLSQFGWRAVAVCGFIPPAAFMEFLSLGVLPIACDMRAKEHIAYTPAPDIVHEAAGHAPILADPEYADYLLAYGELARKVIFSDQDMNVYEAIRLLSDTKENPASTEKDIDLAQKKLDEALAAVTYVSEAQEFSRMAWWTLEYGLVGDMKAPKIYGAGLLSSLGESVSCLRPPVKHIPFSLDCIKYSYDITRPQPQLFVAKDFDHLSSVLKELEDRMAFRRGGLEGLKKAHEAKTVTTAEFDSGVQVSGLLTEIILDDNQNPAYLKYTGPVQVAYRELEIEGQDACYHHHGFGCPVGALKGGKKLSNLKASEIKKILEKDKQLEFESGLIVAGKLVNTIGNADVTQVIVLNPCTVTFKGEVLFKPEWGNFDLACGQKVTAVFGGAADREKYFLVTGGYKQPPVDPKTNLTAQNSELNSLFEKVEEQRAKGGTNAGVELMLIYKTLAEKYPQEWLLRISLLEFKNVLSSTIQNKIKDELNQIGKTNPEVAPLIARGLKVFA